MYCLQKNLRSAARWISGINNRMNFLQQFGLLCPVLHYQYIQKIQTRKTTEAVKNNMQSLISLNFHYLSNSNYLTDYIKNVKYLFSHYSDQLLHSDQNYHKQSIILYNIITKMKLVKRVSIYKGIKRIAEPHPASFKINQLFYNMTKPYRMTIQQELFKYGYKNYPYNIKFILLAIVALALGVTLEQAQRQLMKNQVQTIYSYKIGESTNSTIVMSIRRFFFWLYVQNLMCVLLPAHELILLKGVGQNYQQKFVRVGQYRYFQKHRDNKYDFLELGVLEKFPYPLGLKTSEAGM